MTATERIGYWLAVFLVWGLALYNGFWLVLDLGVRLDLLDGIVFGIDVRGFTEQLSGWNVVFFTVAALSGFLAAGLILRRSHWTVWAFGGMLGAGAADWILLVGNTDYDGSGAGFITTALSIATLGLLWLLANRQALR